MSEQECENPAENKRRKLNEEVTEDTNSKEKQQERAIKKMSEELGK